MRCATFLVIIKFMIALPYNFSVFAVGVPDFRAMPASAVTAFYLTRKNVCTTLSVFTRMSSCHLILDYTNSCTDIIT